MVNESASSTPPPFTARLGVIASMVMALIPVGTPAAPHEPLSQIYAMAWSRGGAKQYEPPQPGELAATEELFVRLLQGESPTTLDGLAQRGGWQLRLQLQAGRVLTLVSERAPAGNGRGIYAFSSQGRHAMQAPHVPSDKHTGEILLRYGNDAMPRAIAWNTVPRSLADMAHMDATDLIAFSIAFARVYPAEKIIQLHGYDSGNRQTAAAASSAAIVSAAHTQPSRELRDAVRCMKLRVDAATRLYGDDVQELGGTTNSVARALRATGHGNFIHLELNLPLREQLLGDSKKRQALFACLGGTP